MAASHVRPGVRKSRSTLQAALRISTPVRDWHARVLDISLSGMRVERPDDFGVGVGQPLEVELHCDDLPATRLRARLVRSGEGDIALKFDLVSVPLETELKEMISRFGRLRDAFD